MKVNLFLYPYRIYNDMLVGEKIRGFYETGWHTGTIMYFNTNLEEYLVTFADESEDYIKRDDIDGSNFVLLSGKSRRNQKSVDYRKLAGI